MIISLTFVKKQLEKYLLWPELHHTWELRRKAIFTSQFSYCLLVWLCHSRTNNNKINRPHKRCLRIDYNDKQSSFNELPEKDGPV